tara:strand:- start:38 stop:199 length:162 start_codon:yes stop_codon:yes gene_type:complete
MIYIILISLIVILFLYNTIIEMKIKNDELKSLNNNLKRFEDEWKNKYANKGEK